MISNVRILLGAALLLPFFFVSVTPLIAEVHVEALDEAYRDYDMQRRDGEGYSCATDSGALGWSQGAIMIAYINMWEGTGNSYWLEKICEHFQRIKANAVDLEGDGYQSWYTTRYNEAIAWTDRLHNVSLADVEPALQRIRNRQQAERATGHSYLIDFRYSGEKFRIIDWDTREIVADGLSHNGTETQVTAVEPFTFTITGATHQGDRFLIRTKAPELSRFAVHQGRILYPVARLIEAVQRNPDLQDRFGTVAEEYLEFINLHIFEKNERDWLEMGELGGAYRFEPKITDRFPNRIMPHNQYAELARVWLVLKDVEGAHPLMRDRAEKMVRYFQNHLEFDAKHDAYVWRYWNWTEAGEAGSSGFESTNYASISTGFAAEAARRGVVFTDEDMRRFANTWLRVMWNRDEQNPMLASNVKGDGAHRFSPLTQGFVELAEWEPRIHDLAVNAFSSLDEPERIPLAHLIVLSAARAGR